MDVAVQPQRGVHGQEGVVAVDVHAQRQGQIGHQGADGAQADDAQRLFINLRTHKGGLALFHYRGDVHAGVHLFPDPADGAVHVPGAQQHGAQHQLLHRVGVGTGGVEHGDTRLGTAVQGNVVHTHARPGNGQQTGGEFVVQQFGGADQDAVGIGLAVTDGVAFGIELAQAQRRNLVECLDAVHGTIAS